MIIIARIGTVRIIRIVIFIKDTHNDLSKEHKQYIIVCVLFIFTQSEEVIG